MESVKTHDRREVIREGGRLRKVSRELSAEEGIYIYIYIYIS
jgi:hypothetical protein